MAVSSVILCDLNQIYARKLAAFLTQYTSHQTKIQILDPGDQLVLEETKDQLVLCDTHLSKEHRDQLEEAKGQDKTDIWCLVEEDVATFPVQRQIKKCQSAKLIAQEVRSWNRKKNKTESVCRTKQNWYGVVSAPRHEMQIPFAVTLAQILGERQKVLLIPLLELSGFSRLLAIEESVNLENLILGMRNPTFTTDLSPENYSVVLGDVNCILPPENPMVLYEMTREDVKRLAHLLEQTEAYDAIVWIFDNMIQGIPELLGRCSQVYALEKKGLYSECRQEALRAFLSCVQPELERHMEPIHLPVLPQETCGEHMLWQWKASGLGTFIREKLGEQDRMIREEPMDAGDEL